MTDSDITPDQRLVMLYNSRFLNNLQKIRREYLPDAAETYT